MKKNYTRIAIYLICVLLFIYAISYCSLYAQNSDSKSKILELQQENSNIQQENISLENQKIELQNKLNCLNSEYINYQTDTAQQMQNNMSYEQSLIEPFKELDKKTYLTQYKNIIANYSDYFDTPETIYDYTTDEEFDLFARVVQSEIGGGSFDQKCNVASTIINRYYSEKFPNEWMEILKQTNQYSCINNGACVKANVTEDTILAIEYVFMIGDTTNGATYFHSGRSLWHERNLHFIFSDGKHKFYKVKEKK